VLRVRPGSAAEKAGLEGVSALREGIVPGDVIVAVDGRTVDSVGRLLARLDERRVGDRVTHDVVRGETARRVEVELQPGN
jgi:S1-C subfamily serine protease